MWKPATIDSGYPHTVNLDTQQAGSSFRLFDSGEAELPGMQGEATPKPSKPSKFNLPPAVKNVIAGLEREKGSLQHTIAELEQRLSLADKRLEEERAVVKALEQEVKRMVQAQEQIRRDSEENLSKLRKELTEARARAMAMESEESGRHLAQTDAHSGDVLQGLEQQLATVQNKAREFKDAMHFWKDKSAELESALEKRAGAVKQQLTVEHQREREVLELQAHRAGTALSAETAARALTEEKLERMEGELRVLRQLRAEKQDGQVRELMELRAAKEDWVGEKAMLTNHAEELRKKNTVLYDKWWELHLQMSGYRAAGSGPEARGAVADDRSGSENSATSSFDPTHGEKRNAWERGLPPGPGSDTGLGGSVSSTGEDFKIGATTQLRFKSLEGQLIYMGQHKQPLPGDTLSYAGAGGPVGGTAAHEASTAGLGTFSEQYGGAGGAAQYSAGAQAGIGGDGERAGGLLLQQAKEELRKLRARAAGGTAQSAATAGSPPLSAGRTLAVPPAIDAGVLGPAMSRLPIVGEQGGAGSRRGSSPRLGHLSGPSDSTSVSSLSPTLSAVTAPAGLSERETPPLNPYVLPAGGISRSVDAGRQLQGPGERHAGNPKAPAAQLPQPARGSGEAMDSSEEEEGSHGAASAMPLEGGGAGALQRRWWADEPMLTKSQAERVDGGGGAAEGVGRSAAYAEGGSGTPTGGTPTGSGARGAVHLRSPRVVAARSRSGSATAGSLGVVLGRKLMDSAGSVI